MCQKVSGTWPHIIVPSLFETYGDVLNRPNVVPVFQRSPVRETASDRRRVKRRVVFNVNELIHILFNTWSATSSSGFVPFWNPKLASSRIRNLQSSPITSITNNLNPHIWFLFFCFSFENLLKGSCRSMTPPKLETVQKTLVV